jgi:hypothetical protein
MLGYLIRGAYTEQADAFLGGYDVTLVNAPGTLQLGEHD